MSYRALSSLLCVLMCAVVLQAQQAETEIKVYDFDDGLSHRNVFHIAQDSAGLIWLATINGLNRFDGYGFKHFSSQEAERPLAVDVISDIALDDKGQLMLASPDYMSLFSPYNYAVKSKKIKKGALVRRESLAPNNLCFAYSKWWCTIYDEKVGENHLAFFESDSLHLVRKLKDAHTNRPFVWWNKQLLFAEQDNHLSILDEQGAEVRSLTVGEALDHNTHPRIVDMQSNGDQLYILLNDSRIYIWNKGEAAPQLLALKTQLDSRTRVGTLCLGDDGDLWVGGLGVLWYYNEWTGEWVDYDATIRQLVKNTCTYRQIFRDASKTVWLATDFGAIKLTQFESLFTQYLSGGSEYCSNVYCSTRGITEDEEGTIFIAYYNSIHVLEPENNAVRPLFPNNDYFNYPFGIAYHDNHLYTGNGLKINLSTLAIDTLFHLEGLQGGAVTVDQDEHIWIGYGANLFEYTPNTNELMLFEDAQGQWDSLSGVVSYIYESPYDQDLWVATLDNGVHRIRKGAGRIAHYYEGAESELPLPSNKVNAILQTAENKICLGTAQGLAVINPVEQTQDLYTKEQGLPNMFINGVLSEGDSCLWMSTDNGLCRFSLDKLRCINFYTADGLSSNEFNRISFFKSSTGRMYFGGLNGLNAFMPNDHFLIHKEERQKSALILTSASYIEGKTDSLRASDFEVTGFTEPFVLEHDDHMLTASFALMDFRNPEQNVFQHYLEGFETVWSKPTTVGRVRYTDLPPGEYVLHVRAHAAQEDWNDQELSIPVIVKPAFYERVWFWPFMALLALALIILFVRMRVRALKKRREELEREVSQRTQELEKEKEKSEELLLNILPAGMAEELKENGFAKAKRHEMVTVMFSDFKSFSLISEQLEPEELVAEIDLCFRAFDEITERHGLEKIKTIGDAYLLVGGLGEKGEEQAKHVVRAALEIQEFMAAIAVERKINNHHFFEARIGIHTGPLVAGVVGIRKFAYDIWGSTVNIASRMESNGEVGRVNISKQTYELIKDEFECSPNGVFSENNTVVEMFLIRE